MEKLGKIASRALSLDRNSELPSFARRNGVPLSLATLDVVVNCAERIVAAQNFCSATVTCSSAAGITCRSVNDALPYGSV